LAAFREGRDLCQKLADDHPGEPAWLLPLASCHVKVGHLAETEGDNDAARREYDRAMELRRAACEQEPKNLDWRTRLAHSLEKVGDVLYAANDLAGAEKHYRESLAMLDGVIGEDGTNSEWHRQRVNLMMSLGLTLTYEGRSKDALKV